MPLDSILENKGFITTLVGAFAGALGALAVNELQRIRREMDGQHAALLKAQYTLGVQIQSLLAMRKQHLSAMEKQEHRGLIIPMFVVVFPKLRLDFQDLTFLAAKDHPQLLNDLLLAQTCFETSVECVEQRNRLKERFQALSKPVEFDSQSMLGRVVVDGSNRIEHAAVEQITAHLYESVDDSISKLDAAIVSIARTGKSLFPERKFLIFETEGNVKKERPQKII
jgi:hypothetical protein